MQDRRVFNALRRTLAKEALSRTGDWMLSLGRYFLGTPYMAGTLDQGAAEALVVNLRAFDCFTFVENIVVLARLFSSEHAPTFEQYRDMLMQIRYRGGRPEGFASRLHYYSDWLFENRRKGFVKDESHRLGGRRLLKKIDFMTGHPANYSPLIDQDVFRQMRAVEKRMQRRATYFIPEGSLEEAAPLILDGDLIAITTAVDGLDVSHVGFAAHEKQWLHLLHASSRAGKVILSPEPLDRYLASDKSRTGIMVARVTGNAPSSGTIRQGILNHFTV